MPDRYARRKTDTSEEAMLAFFRYEHFGPEFVPLCEPFASLARVIVHEVPRSLARGAILWRLLEMRDQVVKLRLGR